jgi:hypothetical protein
VAENGLHPQLASLELLIYPTSASLIANDQRASAGTIEIAAVEAPLTLLVWGRRRVVPVRLTEFSVTEEAFDTMLNPTRVRVSLGLRVLSTDDLGFAHRGGALYLLYQQQKERLATLSPSARLSDVGLTALPGG